ncbi:MAG: hypothetical protein Q9227_006845 [Pyrenula ochraceoflavens]
MDPNCPLCELMIKSSRSKTSRCNMRFQRWRANFCLDLEFNDVGLCQDHPPDKVAPRVAPRAKAGPFSIILTKIANEARKPSARTKRISGRCLESKVNFDLLKLFLNTTESANAPKHWLQPWMHPNRSPAEAAWARRLWDTDLGSEDYREESNPRIIRTNIRHPGQFPLNFRLIDVHQGCLVEAPTNPRYVALSYVWGPPRPDQFKTGKSNVHAFHQPGALSCNKSSLPRTIADAQVAADNLGYDYLWVDALCIVQDDDKDKQNQLKMMASIYNLASFTIVAASGDEADSGLPGVNGTPREHWQYVFGHGASRFANRGFQLEPLMLGSAWFSRAWTFQEFALSSRLLIFTGKQVYFLDGRQQFEDQASCFYQSETDVSRIILDPFDRQWGDERSIIPSCHIISQQPRPLANLRTTLSTYPARNLTYHSDALNAFEGIAGYLGQGFRGTFFNGLPSTCLEVCLCWQVPPSRDHPQSRQGFPSYTWASYHGKIEIETLNNDRLPSMRVLWKNFHNDRDRDWICDEDLLPKPSSKEAKKWKLVTEDPARSFSETVSDFSMFLSSMRTAPEPSFVHREYFWKDTTESASWQHSRPILPAHLQPPFDPTEPGTGHLHFWTHAAQVTLLGDDPRYKTVLFEGDSEKAAAGGARRLNPDASLVMDGTTFQNPLEIIILWRDSPRYEGTRYNVRDRGFPYPRSRTVVEQERLGRPWDVVRFRDDAVDAQKRELGRPYHVLVVETVEGVSYRRGVGRVVPSKFHRVNAYRKYVVLG